MLDLITASPDWSKSRFYPYLVVTYDESVDVPQVTSSFSSDIFVVRSGYVGDLDFRASSVSGSPKATGQNINRGGVQVDLGMSAAWELSEGMGYIGAIDLGLQYDHPNLITFDNAGNYFGGNILDDFYQIDFAVCNVQEEK